jgi:tripartite-type tricarboxylate transporter receptor subunit TctC
VKGFGAGPNPGGGTDVVGRIFAQKFSEAIGQTVIVENRPRAGTMIGTAYVARSVPDGLTLLINGSALAYHPSIFKSLPYDIKKDLIPVAFISEQPYVLLVNRDFAANSIDDLVALAKEQPGRIPYASAGVGSAMHLAAELLWSDLGIKMLHIPYRGTGPAMTDLLAGEVKVIYTTATGAADMVRAGQVKALGISSAERSPTMPDVPTIAEAALPGYQHSSWLALFAPGGTPDAILKAISDAAAKALHDPELATRFAAQGLSVRIGSPEELRTFFQQEVHRWAPVIKAAGIEPQ